MSTFELLPAIDLLDGRVVRLEQGDYSRVRTYGDDALLVARRFAAQGASWIHVVDLDGARAGEPRQLALVAAIVAGTPGRLQVELGGGVRTVEALSSALDAGVDRVVLGTAALRDPAVVRQAVELAGARRIVASIDVRAGRAVGEGWRMGAPGIDVREAIGRLADAGIGTFEVTAIERDGLLEGPDHELLRSLVGLGRGRIIASGGLASIADVLAVRDAGCEGAIVGRALYEGRFELADAVGTIKGRPAS